MDFSRFKISLEANKPANSKNGVILSKKKNAAEVCGVTTSININLIKENPDQARSFMNEKEFAGLKQSIKREGLLHPLIVLNTDKTYYLKAGHRRIRALKELGYTEVECSVFTSKVEATFAAISTNEFAERVHPIDKGVEVESLISQFETEGISFSIKDIADFYGVAESTIYEWRSYLNIDRSVRAEIIAKGIRTQDFLRKAIRICKDVRKQDLSEKQKTKVVNNRIVSLIDSQISKEKIKAKTVTESSVNLDAPRIRNFLYYSQLEDEFHIRKSAVEKLSVEERERLKHRAEELLQLL